MFVPMRAVFPMQALQPFFILAPYAYPFYRMFPQRYIHPEPESTLAGILNDMRVNISAKSLHVFAGPEGVGKCYAALQTWIDSEAHGLPLYRFDSLEYLNRLPTPTATAKFASNLQRSVGFKVNNRRSCCVLFDLASDASNPDAQDSLSRELASRIASGSLQHVLFFLPVRLAQAEDWPAHPLGIALDTFGLEHSFHYIEPLSARPNDVRRYLPELAANLHPHLSIGPEAEHHLLERSWPANHRELTDFLMLAGHLALSGGSGLIDLALIQSLDAAWRQRSDLSLISSLLRYPDLLFHLRAAGFQPAMRVLEGLYLQRALILNRQIKSRAAKSLNLPLSTFISKLKKAGIFECD